MTDAATTEADECLRKKDLFTILQGYASTLEVQYMIDQSLDKFVAKKLNALIEAGVAAQLGHGAASPRTANERHRDDDGAGPTAPSLTTSTSVQQSADWMETLVRAKIEAELPQLVEAEVRRQLEHECEATRGRAGDEAGAPSSRRAVAAPRSPPPAERPPLPPGASPPRKPPAPNATTTSPNTNVNAAPSFEEDDADPHLGPLAAASTASPDTTATTAAAPARSDAVQQRARILEAIQDVERQVNALQRQVNELSHQDRAHHQRLGRVCLALSPAGWKGPASACPSPPPSALALSTSLTADREAAETAPVISGVPASAPSSAPQQVNGSGIAATFSSAAAAAHYGVFYATLMDALDAGETSRVHTLLSDALTALVQTVPSVDTAANGDCEASPKGQEAADQPVAPRTGDNSPQRSPSALRQSPIVASAPPAPSVNDSISSSGYMSSPPLRAVASTAGAGSGARPPQPVLPLYTRHMAAPPLAADVFAQPGTGAATPQLGVDAVDVPGGLLPSALGLRGGGVRVLSVAKGQVAEQSGLLPGDVLLRVRQTPIETCAQLRTALRGVQAHEIVPVEVYRHSDQVLLSTVLLF